MHLRRRPKQNIFGDDWGGQYSERIEEYMSLRYRSNSEGKPGKPRRLKAPMLEQERRRHGRGKRLEAVKSR
jgi:hypothetical protein